MDDTRIKKLLPMIITALLWDINFRLTFKNMDAHMDLGCYSSLKYDPLVILIKNISTSIIFLSMYLVSKKFNSNEKKFNKLKSVKAEGSTVVYEYEEEKNLFLGSLIKYHNLFNRQKQIIFCIKTFLLILFIYIFE